jgi:hypothetical protein
VDPGVAVGRAGFEEENTVAAGFTEAGGHGATGRAGTSDDVVKCFRSGWRHAGFPRFGRVGREDDGDSSQWVGCGNPLLCARDDAGTLRPCRRQEAFADGAKQARRQQAEVEPAFVVRWYWAKVRAWPGETIHFVHDDPGARSVEPKSLFDNAGKFYRISIVRRPGVGDGQNRDHRFAGLVDGGQDNGAGTVLLACLTSLHKFRMPKVRVTDDQTRLWDRQRHRLFEFVVEMLMPRVHFCFGDYVKFGVGQIAGAKHFPGATVEAAIFLGREHDQTLAAVAGDGDRLHQRLILVAPEMALEFGGGDGDHG